MNGSNLASSKVISNEDLLTQIFDATVFLDRGGPLTISKVARSSLLHAALTCTKFLEPALNVLWRDLDSLWPLLQILTTYFRLPSGLIFSEATITESSLLRFKYYSVRVRILRGLSGPLKIYSTTISYIAAIVGGDSLIPSLREIHISLIHEVSSHLLLNVISPHLRVLTMRNVVGLYLLGLSAQYLQLLGAKEPPLKVLVISGQLSSNLLDMCRTFRSLGLVEFVYQVPTPNLISLGCLRSLRSLVTLRLSPSDTTIGPYASGLVSLPNVEQLFIKANPAAALALMRHLQVPNLFRFNLELVKARKEDEERVKEIIQRIPTISKSFRVFVFYFKVIQLGGLRSLPNDWIQSMPVVLTQLRIMDTHVCLRDADVRELCESGVFKSLEQLEIPYFPPDCSPTLACLVHFSKHCTRLTQLCFGIPILFRQLKALAETIESYTPSDPHITIALVLGPDTDPPPQAEWEKTIQNFFASIRGLFPDLLYFAVLDINGLHRPLLNRYPHSRFLQTVGEALPI